MIHQIEQKVVNRLRQVTSAIRQQGANQVAIIKSGAERAAAAEFAHASAVRPYLVGKAIQEIAKDKEILNTVFEILETEKMLDGEVELTLIPRDNIFARLLATGNSPRPSFPLHSLVASAQRIFIGRSAIAGSFSPSFPALRNPPSFPVPTAL